jgi:hypothetical protein
MSNPKTVTPQEMARAILALYDGKPERWTKDTFARDASGAALPPERRGACAWCIAGAAERVALSALQNAPAARDAAFAFRMRVSAIVPGGHDARWNDSPARRFRHVVALLERIAAEPEAAP